MKRIIHFQKYRYIAFAFSFILLVLFVGGSVIRGGINMGVDFVGGMKIIAQFEEKADEASIREALSDYNPMVQQIGQDEKNEYIISTKLGATKNRETGAETLRKVLQEKFGEVTFLSVENVGPAIGQFLRKSAIQLFLVALILMTIYLTFRFELKYSAGAMAALVHDLGLTVAFCGFAGVEINIPVIAALLTIFGYSVNDTIVIFDRVRENVYMKTTQAFRETINLSITQSISRTLLTSLTTLFAVLALYLIGGEGLNDFALVLLFGIFVGTYSSVYIASPVIDKWDQVFSK